MKLRRLEQPSSSGSQSLAELLAKAYWWIRRGEQNPRLCMYSSTVVLTREEECVCVHHLLVAGRDASRSLCSHRQHLHPSSCTTAEQTSEPTPQRPTTCAGTSRSLLLVRPSLVLQTLARLLQSSFIQAGMENDQEEE
jgi:hypothetical protein